MIEYLERERSDIKSDIIPKQQARTQNSTSPQPPANTNAIPSPPKEKICIHHHTQQPINDRIHIMSRCFQNITLNITIRSSWLHEPSFHHVDRHLLELRRAGK